jgi:hypothetical protein
MIPPTQVLRILLVSSRAMASADGQRIVLRSSLNDLRVSIEGATPHEVKVRFQHAIEQAAQDKFGGQWLAIPTEEPYGLEVSTDQALAPAFALLPLDALKEALAHTMPSE